MRSHWDLNQNNRTKYIFFDLRKIDDRNKWKNYVIDTRVKLSVELDVLVIREQQIFIQLSSSNIEGVLHVPILDKWIKNLKKSKDQLLFNKLFVF